MGPLEELHVLAAARQEAACFPESESWGVAGIGGAIHDPKYLGLALLGSGPLDGDMLRGFSLSRQAIVEEAEILLLVVDRPWRGQGLGRGLLDATLDRLRARGARETFLLVRESNLVARCLYEERGFRVIARRPGVYHDPPESGFELRLDLDGTSEPKAG